MSTATRKVHSDIEFIEGEAIRLSNRPADWQQCESMLRLFVEAYYWFRSAAIPLLKEWDAEACEELITLAQRALHVVKPIEQLVETQLKARRDVENLSAFRQSVTEIAQIRDELLVQFDAHEKDEWAEVRKNAPSNEELLESAKRLRAPQEWYDEKPDTSPLD